MSPGETYFSVADVMTAPQAEKHQMLGTLIDGMSTGDQAAGNTAFSIGRTLLGSRPADFSGFPTLTDESIYTGILTPGFSLDLIRTDPNRLQGYFNAIRRWDPQELILDVGSGPFAVMGLAAAVLHPEAEVEAVEIYPTSAEVAADVVELFKMSDKVHVLNADIGTNAIDTNTTAAVTETFNTGITSEPGPEILRRLYRAGIPTLTPSKAEIRLQIGNALFSANVDFRTDEYAHIPVTGEAFRIESSERGYITAAFSDDKGLILDHNTSSITEPLPLSQFNAPLIEALSAGATGVIVYRLGDLFRPKLVLD